MATVFQHFTSPIWLLVIIGAALLHAALAPRSANPLAKYPLVSRRRWYDILGFWERAEFLLMGARKPLVAAKEYELRQAFRIRDPWGEILVLPAEDAQYLKSHTSFAFELFFNGRTHASLNDGLAGFLELAKLPNIVSQGVKNNLTQVSNRWEEIPVSDAVVKIVHRVSSRTFIGDDGPRNAEWLDLAQNYTPDVSFAGFILDLMPPQLRPLVQWFLPAIYRSRKQIRAARRLVASMMDERRRQHEVQPAAAAVNPKERVVVASNDAIGWFDRAADGDVKLYDAAAAQLALTFVADHTSANFIMMVLLDLARHPEVAKEVRREIEQEVNQIGWMGWEKGNLHRMKLLDSVIKESMRLRPIFFAAMLGGVTEAMSLKDGTVLPVGTRIAVAGDGNRDPAVYDRPDEWDAYRFYKMRQTGDREDMAQLACATVEHAGFGVGKHSCPGRFYAADVMKIVLCHLLMKYDWKTLEGGPETVVMGWTQMVHPEAKILVRRRG
ncbi:putative ent-kaurene oxidase [Colletotrichum sublineola]|uniref:Putative ent-kaurene oxidase n=1 Tax=Colletotrichum sublineola TaxID=1173701 RepID=A0A066XS63_COLSU|nr:putative ent-kaurene oxidase [Colletotrichum sublineola]